MESAISQEVQIEEELQTGDVPPARNRVKAVALAITIVFLAIFAFGSHRYVTANAVYDEALDLEEVGKISEAKRGYQKAIQLNPWHADATYELAVVLRKEGKLDDALRLMLRALALNNQEVDYHLGVGFLYLNDLRQPGKAKPYLERAYDLDGKNYYAVMMMGKLAEAEKSVEIAEFYYKKAAAVSPELTAAHRQLALFYTEKGMKDEAREAWQNVLKINPDDKEAKSQLASLR